MNPRTFLLCVAALVGCGLGVPQEPVGGTVSSASEGLTLLKGELFAGSGAQSRKLVARVQLRNTQKTPMPLVATRFKVRLSTGVELPGSATETLALKDGCAQLGDVSVGASVTCSIAFLVDLSSPSVVAKGLAYTLSDESQWVVSKSLPTCDQCGEFHGCADFSTSNWACGQCGNACSSGRSCSAGVCREVVAVAPSAGSCAATCAPGGCVGMAYYNSADCTADANAGRLQCETELATLKCPILDCRCAR
jgi:Stigma-specific protein, Stig1